MVINKEPDNKSYSFYFDYQQELQIWRENLARTENNVLCETCGCNGANNQNQNANEILLENFDMEVAA